MAKHSRQEIVSVQRSCNRFTRKYLSGIKPLRVDGVLGRATRSRIMLIKFYLGYGKRRNSEITSEFVRRMRHPHTRKYFPKGMIGTGMGRRAKQRAQWSKNHVKSYAATGVTRYDGVPVAKWMVPYLQWARAHGWSGRLTSGWRDPKYSQSLCYRMCGAPRCPGKCAGLSSNHVGSSRPRGAVDVSDYYRFGALMRRCPLSPRIFNALGSRDPVHFSASGN